MHKNLLAGVAGATLLTIAGPASAAFIFSEGNVGGTGVHSSTGFDQTGTTVYGTVGIGGELVTLSSSGTLNLNGSGEAIIDGDPLNDLLVQFISSYGVVGWNVELPGGQPPDGGYAMTVSVNGGSTAGVDLFTVDPLSPPQKYFITGTEGDAINSLAFTFEPGVDAMKQIRLSIAEDGGGGSNEIPEPATWTMMLLGFGGVGALLRQRRRLLQAV
jgi:hypothetical protein